MNRLGLQRGAIALLAFFAFNLQESRAQSITAVPHVVRINGVFHPANGGAAPSTVSVTLGIYKDERGGAPLWMETQNIALDSDGHYDILLGATVSDGIPAELFSDDQPRWLEVRFHHAGESEQSRVRMASVPYAIKAGDAQTLGGLPSSAYLLNPSALPPKSSANALAWSESGARNVTPLLPRANPSTAGNIPVYSDSVGDLGNSVMYQFGSRVGLGTTTPNDFFHVVFSDTTGGFTGLAVQNLAGSAASYSGMLFYDQNGLLAQFQGFNNATHEYRINNIASGGSVNFMLGSDAKFRIAPSGDVGIENNLLQFRSTGSSPARSMKIEAGSPAAGATDLKGGDLILAAGVGTGAGASGDLHLQTAGGDASGTSDNVLVDRMISVGKSKALALGYTDGDIHLISAATDTNHAAGGRLYYTLRATYGVTGAYESGVILFLLSQQSDGSNCMIIDKITVGIPMGTSCYIAYPYGSTQPVLGFADSPAIPPFGTKPYKLVHEIYFSVENQSSNAIRLEP